MLKPLPINTSYTVHDILVPSLRKTLRFRPFLVKESKALMIAHSSNDPIVMLNTLKTIIASCCVEQQPLDVDKLATFDFEYILVKLRSISVDNSIVLNVTCSDPHDGKDPITRQSQVSVDLSDIEIVGLDKYTNTIKLSDQLTVVMKLPMVGDNDTVVQPDDYQGNLQRVLKQIDKICTSDGEVYDVSEYSLEQLDQWIDSLSDDQLIALLQYFQNIPYCRIKVEWTCPVCGKRNIQYIEGISYFF